jgi:Transposase, Mutator family
MLGTCSCITARITAKKICRFRCSSITKAITMRWLMPARAADVSSPPSSPLRLRRTMPRPPGAQWRKVADQLRPKLPKLAAFLDEAETDVLAYMSFPPQHRTKLHSTNPIERLNGEIKRRTEVVGIFPNEDAIVRLIGVILLEQKTNGPSSVPVT